MTTNCEICGLVEATTHPKPDECGRKWSAGLNPGHEARCEALGRANLERRLKRIEERLDVLMGLPPGRVIPKFCLPEGEF